MNIFDFENRVRSAANNVQHDLDMERLLSDLNLQSKPSRFRILLPYFGFAGLMLISAMAYFSFSSETTINTNTLERTEIAEKPNPKENSIAIKTTKQNTLDKEVKTVVQSNLVQQSIPTAIKKESKKPVRTTSIAPPAEPRINNSRSINLIPQKNTIIIKEETIDQKDNLINTNQQSQKAIIAAINTTNSLDNSTDIEPNISTTVLDKLPLLSTYMTEELPKNLHKKVAECPKFTDGNWNFAVVPEVGALFPIKSLNVKDSRFTEIFEDRKRNESSQLSFSSGISVQFRNKITGLYIRPGFNYTRIEETFTNEDTKFVTNEVQYQVHQYNIPIAIGTSLDQGKFSIKVEGGLIFNFLQETNGQLFNGDEDFIMLDTDQSLFKESVGLGFFAGTTINTKLNSNTELFVGPRFIFNTLSTSSNQNPIDQRYSFVGLNAGIVYTLF